MAHPAPSPFHAMAPRRLALRSVLGGFHLLQSLWHRRGASSLPLQLLSDQNGRQFRSRRHLLGRANVSNSPWERTSPAPASVSSAPCASLSVSTRPSPAWTPVPFHCAGAVLPLRSRLTRCYASEDVAETRKLPSRLAQKALFLQEKTGEALSEEEMNAPIPKIGEEHVTVAFARSGGPGGQNVNKVNTKVDMRFNVYNAEWLPERIRLKILDQEANRINADGELVVSSTRTRTQKGNIEDALQKIQKIIDAAAYVPPPPSEEKKAKINRLAKAENERRLQTKKMKSTKKTDRRNKGSWD